MNRWALALNSEVVNDLHNNYLKRISDISTLYAVVNFVEKNIGGDSGFVGENIEIPLSSNFPVGFTTVKSIDDIASCSLSGALHQINCYQVVVSLVSNFENLIDALAALCGISNNVANSTLVSVYGESIESPVLRKLKAIHNHLSISSNAIGNHELQYYYKIIKLRNRIVHQHGRLKGGDEGSLDLWVRDGAVAFNANHIDDFIHFFLMPLTSMVAAFDEKWEG